MNVERVKTFTAAWMMELILLAICAYLAFSAPNFLSTGNLINVLRSVSLQGIIAFGLTMVIISREVDFSIGSAVAFSGCLIAWLLQQNCPFYLAFPLTLLVGFSFGAFAGFMRAWFLVPTLITSLALYTGLKGGALLITNGFPITSFPSWFQFLGGGYIAGVPFPTVVFVIVFILTHFTLNHTTFGRSVYAVGGNPEAARLCGINVDRVRTLSLAITQMLAALSGIMLASRIMSGSPTVGQGWEFDIIAAVFIGGTSVIGGAGTVWGTLLGVVFIGVIINGLTLLNVPIYLQYVVRGGLILAAVLINRMHATMFIEKR